VGQREAGAALATALRLLPEEQRQVLVLAYFGGLSQSQIADQLAIPLGTVKKGVRLGMDKLRDRLAPRVARAAE
jgi:RNA polymerase sigma-70 factor, ECF subfamily